MDKRGGYLVNTRAKGTRTWLKGKKELEDQGWIVEKVEKTGRFIKQKDLFGCFDAIALRGPYQRWIQFKTNQAGSLKPYREFSIAHKNPYMSVEVWVWHDHKGFRKILL